MDLDDFKIINDTHGHKSGDELLKQVTQRLNGLFREYDVLARFGGDEFVIMLPHTCRDQLVQIAEKILKHLQDPFTVDGLEHIVGASIGISFYPNDGEDQETLLQNADIAMYKAKEAGRNCFRFFSADMNEELKRQQYLEQKLRLAINNNELSILYQPQYDLNSAKLIGVEALLRWHIQGKHAVSPAEFIPIAEKSHLIIDIGNWVLNEACKQSVLWKKQGADIHIDINVSGHQLNTQNIFETISNSINKYGLTYTDIGIELTENMLIQTNENSLKNMEQLVNNGTSISVDDFGTGYSSLKYLKQFPVTIVKIDQSFVQDSPTDENDRAIIKAINAMSHSLGLKVIVEGVETLAQIEIVKELGSDYAQGYFYAKPLAPEDVIKLVLHKNTTAL